MRIFKFWALAALVAGLLLSGIGTGRLMAGGEPGTLTAWRVPTPDPGLEGIAVAPSGEVYFTEVYGDRIGRLDPFTDVITEWPVGGGPRYLALGSSGQIYFTEGTGNGISWLNPSYGFYSSETVPTGGGQPTGIALTTSGGLKIWFAERLADKIGMLAVGGFVFDAVQPRTPMQQAVSPMTAALTPTTTVVMPSITATWGSPPLPPAVAMIPGTTSGPFTEWPFSLGMGHPRMLTVGPGGDLWISTETASIIQFVPGSNTFYFHDLPSGSAALDVAVDSAGYVWFTESWEDKVGRLDPTTGNLIEWPLPSGSQPFALALAPDGSVWFSEREGDRIGHLEPWSNTITEYQLGANSHPLGIALDASGDVWFTTERGNYIGRLSIGPVLGPPPGGLPVVNLDIDRGCGANYNPGDPLTFSYSVSETAVVTLIDFETSGNIEQIVLGTAPAGVSRIGTGVITGPAGVETLVLVARTLSGVYISTGCSFGIGGVSPSLVSVTLDRGCGALYYYGETATVTLRSTSPAR